jgi:hypothetical protein
MYDWLADVAAGGSFQAREFASELADRVVMISKSFGGVVGQVRKEDGDVDGQKDQIISLLVTDDTERVGLYQGIVGYPEDEDKRKFWPLSQERAERAVTSAFEEAEDDDQLCAKLQEVYLNYAGSDAGEIGEYLAGKLAAPTPTLLIINLDRLRTTAGMAAGVAMGAALSLLLARRFRRHG